jgi:hypothetical protein
MKNTILLKSTVIAPSPRVVAAQRLKESNGLIGIVRHLPAGFLAFAMFGGVSHAQPVPPSAPLPVCAGGPAAVPDDVEFTLNASCSRSGRTADTQSGTFTGWLTTGLAQGVEVTCSHTGLLGGLPGDSNDSSQPHNLTGRASANIARICVGLPDAATQFVLDAFVSSLAGYELSSICDGGNYCSAKSSLAGNAATTFQINDTQVNQWCLSVPQMNGQTVASPGYPGSSGFKDPGTFKTNYAQLYNPSGQLLNLKSGAAYPLNQIGNWTIQFPISLRLNSQMSETSGSDHVTQDLVVVFQSIAVNGTCPNPQISPAAKSKMIRLPLRKS